MSRPILQIGSRGSDVGIVQTCLAVTPLDLSFGSVTETAVKQFQSQQRLTSDGVVGAQTWTALGENFALPPYPPPLPAPFDQAVVQAICDLAAASAIAHYSWRDRGRAPAGYIKGMALAYATVYRRWHAFDPSARQMAQADRQAPDYDALTWYAAAFASVGMRNDVAGVDTLRHLFVLLMGLGMRESSGKHCEGRDMAADNVTAETAEAGLFQQSWNSSSCSTDIERLLDAYVDASPAQCAIYAFHQQVSCSSSSWGNYGSGIGAEFQMLCKNCPQFAVEAAAIGLRYLRKHWGPINRRDAEIRTEADEMFRAVQDIVIIEERPPESPEVALPTLTVTVESPGSARVVVIGAADELVA